MTKQSRLLMKLKRYWAAKLENHPDAIDQLSKRGFLPTDCSISPLELVAVCSLLTERKPIHEVIESIMIYTVECISPAFTSDYFIQLDETIREIELAGLRSHARDLRKLGKVVATMQSARGWKDHWEHDTDRRLKSAIQNEPFLPQQG
jgi:hypothetical protein